MKLIVKRPVEIEVSHILIAVAVRYEEEDIPNDFPLRDGDIWRAKVEIDTGKIEGWPQGKTGDMHMKVCDEGTYTLLSPAGNEIAKLENEYVPNDVVPGEDGDYIELKIDENGVITNWPKKLTSEDFDVFFDNEE